jgi:3-isopropylmalate/(R)-2-methylmalate dehydratase small subunit
MKQLSRIEGIAAPLPLANLDTDQIMPKQFLRIIDKAGLDKGLLYDMRFDDAGQPRSDCVLNQSAYAGARILVCGPNFACGSSREHAVWGLQQYGIQAVIASSYGEIFYSNAMNNRLLLIELPQEDVSKILHDVENSQTTHISIDLDSMTVRSQTHSAKFTLGERHRRMFLEGLDMIGATLTQAGMIQDFTAQHWKQLPWIKDVAAITRQRLDSGNEKAQI